MQMFCNSSSRRTCHSTNLSCREKYVSFCTMGPIIQRTNNYKAKAFDLHVQGLIRPALHIKRFTIDGATISYVISNFSTNCICCDHILSDELVRGTNACIALGANFAFGLFGQGGKIFFQQYFTHFKHFSPFSKYLFCLKCVQTLPLQFWVPKLSLKIIFGKCPMAKCPMTKCPDRQMSNV